MTAFAITDNRPSKRNPQTNEPGNVPLEDGYYVASAAVTLDKASTAVDERGERLKPGALLARAAFMSLSRRRLLSRRLLTPGAAIDAGYGDLSCQTRDQARLQQDANRQLAFQLKSDTGLRAALDSDEARAAGPLYGGTASCDLHTGVWKASDPAGRIDEAAWRVFTNCLGPRAAPSTLRAPRGTAHGYPSFNTTDADLLAHVALGIEAETAAATGGFKRLVQEVEDTCPSGVGFFVLANTRVQHIKKAQPLHDWGPDGWLHQVGTTTGIFPRNRLVRMVPTWVNEACRPEVQTATDRYKTGPLGHCFSHGRRNVTLRLMTIALHAARRRWGPRARIISASTRNS